MKPPLLLNARRPLPSGRRVLLAVVLPARACFVPERTPKRFAVRGSAPPGRDARRCSPPTATINRNTNVSTVTVWPFIRGSRLYSSEHENHSQTFGMAMLPVRCGDHLDAMTTAHADASIAGTVRRLMFRGTSRRNDGTQVWPKPPSDSVNVLLAALRYTLTAAAFRPGLLLGSGFGKFKARALSFQREHVRLTTQRAAIDVKVMARLLEPCLCIVREFSRVLTRPVTIGKPSPFPLAFRVALLASSDARPNLSGRVLLSVVLGLPLGALAAAPGCMKMLRIFSSRLSGLVVVGCSSSFLSRVIQCAKNARPMGGKTLEGCRERQPGDSRSAASTNIEMN